MDLATVKRNVNTVGIFKTMADIGLRAVNRVVLLKVLNAIRIEVADPAFLECAEAYRGLFLDETMLRELATDPKNELTPAFLDDALAKGDECYGFLTANELAAYGWYSRKPTAIEIPDLRLQFGDQYVYMYKGYTAENHRGQRLHAIGMTRALASYLHRGFRGIVSYVEWNNFASLKSCYRMGYRDFGTIVIAGAGNHYFLHHDSGCVECPFMLQRAGSLIDDGPPLLPAPSSAPVRSRPSGF